MKDKKKHRFLMEMDKKLYAQLLKYSEHLDLSMAQMARKAINQFLQEQEDYENNRQKN